MPSNWESSSAVFVYRNFGIYEKSPNIFRPGGLGINHILIFARTYMAFRKTRSRSSNVAFHAGCSENTVCST